MRNVKHEPQVYKGLARRWYSDSPSSFDKTEDLPAGFDVTIFINVE